MVAAGSRAPRLCFPRAFLFAAGSENMARKALKLASWTSMALAASGIYLYSNKYLDPNDFGAVRVGRAVATTAVISYDYLTSLKSVPYGSEEYLQLRSKLVEATRIPWLMVPYLHLQSLKHRAKSFSPFHLSAPFCLSLPLIKAMVHLRSARRLCELCCANRGTFIKVGQHLGALDYLLPEEYTSTLKVLHSQAPQSSMQEVRQVIREDLGKEIHDLFQSFDDTPLGTASLAQVHKAVLHDGRTVAVKVQHPKVRAQSSKDILLMEVLVLAVKQLFPEFEFMWLVDEAKKNLPLELDFLKEGRNAEKVSQMLKHFDFLKVPRIHWDLSTERVLLMEFVDGGQVNDRDYMERNKIDVNEDLEIRNNAANYLPQISQLLNHVPRQMLLILKTNDLLRGIEAALGTRASASSFLNMSRCCVRALAEHKKKNTGSFFRRTQISFSEAFSLWQINLHELILCVKGLKLADRVLALLCWLFPAVL
ncbi:aarF domain-containing protein kinase 1 isoform X12 [Callithrix jacchus]|uniref:aarF domain-containing protein kinase 1 isoform X10 n=1 Tax=Callithrix jacchus TaxID=9483 RepID=UPI0023DD1FE0|nr:aarF domain-containing protein kinase 1 isoform X10 [Callithrix jacchus]